MTRHFEDPQDLADEVTDLSVSVVGGTDRSARSRRVAAIYAEVLGKAKGRRQFPRGLWIAPHSYAAQQVPGLLRGAGVSATLSPGITTIRRLAEAIVSNQLASPTILPRVASRWLIRQAIDRVEAQGGLQLLAGAIDRPGLVDAVEGTIEQWKSRGIASAETKLHAGSGERERELAHIYAEYERLLHSHRGADRFDLPRLATEGVASEAARHIPMDERPTHEMLIVDLADDITHEEYLLLEQLIRAARRVVVSLPLDESAGEDSVRPELFATSRQQLAWLRGLAANVALEHVSSSDSIPRELAHLRDNLFLPPDKQAGELAFVPAHLQIRPTADPVAELATAARQVKQLIVAQGVAPQEIVVATPTLAADRSRIAEAFASFGIPCWIDKLPPLGESPDVAALVGLVAMHAADWPYRQLLELLSCRLFEPLDAQLRDSRWPTVRATTEWLVRELQVAEGRRALVDYVRHLAEGDPESSAPATPRQQAAQIAIGPLEQLLDALEGLPREATPSDWMDALALLAEQVGLTLDDTPGSAWREVRIAALWIARTHESAEADEAEGAIAVAWTLGECLRFLKDLTRWHPFRAPQRREACVAVTSLWGARHLRPRHLFLIGMGERAFAAGESGRGLLSDEHLDRLASGGRVPSAPAATSRSMRLFHELVATPRESLTLSYAALDARGQQMPPSPMLLELCQTLGPAWLAQLETPPPLGQLGDEGSVPLSVKEWRLRAIADLMEPKPTFEPLASLLATAETGHLARNLVGALRSIHARASGDGFGPWEGMLLGQQVQRRLASKFGPNCIWSASQLETYAECPYKFYLRYVLEIAEQEDLVLATDYRQQGSLAHETLKGLHESLREAMANGTLSAVDQQAFCAEYERCLQQAFHELPAHGAERVLAEILAHQVRKWQPSYFQQHTDYQARSHDWETPLAPQHLEFRFGPASRHSDASEDPDSVDMPFSLTVGTETIRLAGRIDRIDVGQYAGQVVFQIIDYKTSKQVRLKPAELEDGRSLQPTLYAIVAATLLGDGERPAIPLACGYWGVQDKGFDKVSTVEMHTLEQGQLVPTKVWQTLQTAVARRVGQLVAGIRQGEFPMVPADDKICSQCEYRHCCRVQQTRSLEKVWAGPGVTKAASHDEQTR